MPEGTPAGATAAGGGPDPRAAMAARFERWLRQERDRPPARDPRAALAEAFARRQGQPAPDAGSPRAADGRR